MAEEYKSSSYSHNEKLLLSPRISCMELTLKEMGGALKLFAERGPQGDLPSWKYPHRKLKELEVEDIIIQLGGLGMSKERRYIHLVELCIDRMYYSLLTTARNFKLISNKFYADETNLATIIQANQHIFNDFQDLDSYLSNEVTKKPIRMAQLIQQITAYFPLLEGSTLIRSQDKLPLMKNDASRETVPKQFQTQNQIGVRKDAATQIHDGVQEKNCKSCCDIENALKEVAETLEKCVNAVSKRIPGTDTKIPDKGLTQWEVLTGTCEKIQSNCSSIVENVGKNLQKNVILESTIADVKNQYEMYVHECDSYVKQKQWRIFEMTKELQSERYSRRQIQGGIGNIETRCSGLKRLLSEEKEKNEKHSVEGNEMTKVKENLSQLCIQSSQSLEEIKSNFELKVKENEELHLVVHNFQNLRQAEEDEMKKKFKALSHALSKAKTRNERLETMIPAVKKQIQCIQKKRAEDDKRRAEVNAKLESLQTSIKTCKSNLDLLTMYPDLNGHVMSLKGNLHSLDDEDVVETMGLQIIANEERVELLKLENQKLGDTIRNLRIHLNKNKT